MTIPDTIIIKVDDKTKTVDTDAYIKAKTKQMQEFGFQTVTEETISKQLENVLTGKELDIIGMFIESDIITNRPTGQR